MFFNVPDVEKFLAEKEYIDTVIIPILSLDFAEDKMKKSSSAAEFLMSLTGFIEQQFKGRLMILPPFSYMESIKNEEFPILLEAELKKSGFKYVFFITCDHSWTSLKEELNIIWLPSIPLESMDKKVKTDILEEQLKKVIPEFSIKWSQNS